MEKSLHSSNLYSHPDRLLEDHLIGVSRLSELFLSEKPQEIGEQLTNVSRVIALSHDIGKSTDYFQEYLKAHDREKERLRNLKETRHSLLSAICAYFIAKELKTDDLFPFFVFLVVKRHHGDLIDVVDAVIFDNNDAETIQKQIEGINNQNLAILSEKLYEAGLPARLSKEIIMGWLDSFLKESNQLKKYLRKINNGISNYIILNLLYSILLDADKSDVVIRDASIFERAENIRSNWVDNYKKKTIFQPSPINDLRERAYQEIIKRDINPADKIYSINLPTGLGKTFSSLSFALKLRERLGVNHRIIYALPFLSIIDQNSDVFESVMRMNDIEPDTSILLKHHHLSEVFYKRGDNEFEPDEAKILIEGWNAEIIITTFVQLFHTLISNKNKSIRKFHRLANSIIILDEVQSVPIKYWLLLRTILKEFAELLNAYIIFVTATEPLIFGRGEIKGLSNKDFYFSALDRVLMRPSLDKGMTIQGLSKFFDLNNEKTYLFILNTITAAKNFYGMLREKGLPLTYLSTHITPKERLKRIKEIKDNKYKVVVSTQLVEAGVDIDFDIVIRDIAPLDSINQAAGRCNRNGNQKGIVYVIALRDDRGKLYASYIYDSILLDITQKILSGREEIGEGEFLQLIEEYYRETNSKKSQDISKGFLEALTKLKYDSEDDKISISDFRLIEEDYEKIDIFIELDKDAHEVWEKYMKLKDIDDLFMRKREFDSMKAGFYSYVISIPANTQNRPQMVGEMGYVGQSVLEDYYDKETGFIIQDTRSLVIW